MNKFSKFNIFKNNKYKYLLLFGIIKKLIYVIIFLIGF